MYCLKFSFIALQNNVYKWIKQETLSKVLTKSEMKHLYGEQSSEISLKGLSHGKLVDPNCHEK
jgi:hypothetical protein